MNHALFPLVFLSFVLMILFIPVDVVGEEPKVFIPDKALCAKMLRFGKEAYMRGKYLDAKEFFRRAVQADPASTVAWRYYDLATVFALAEKVEKNSDLIAPDVSTRAVPAPGTPPPPPPPASEPVPEKKDQFKIVEDEGC